jgi:hypothetical protein
LAAVAKATIVTALRKNRLNDIIFPPVETLSQLGRAFTISTILQRGIICKKFVIRKYHVESVIYMDYAGGESFQVSPIPSKRQTRFHACISVI